MINANTPKSFYVLPLHNKYHHAFIFQEKGGFVLRQQSVGVRPAQGGHDGPLLLSLPSLPAAGQSLMEGASQITGTNDSTFHQLQQPHPSHAEGPVSLRCLALVTYPNPPPSSLTISQRMYKNHPQHGPGSDFLDLPHWGPESRLGALRH